MPPFTSSTGTKLAKAGDELRLRQLAGTDAVALGNLVGADGLVFLRQGAAGPQARLTAVHMGCAVFRPTRWRTRGDLPRAAKLLAHQVWDYASKLQLSRGQAIPISVLNLRAEYQTAESAATERNLTLLLESRLASSPETVVLERRHAWSLHFERSLAAVPPALLAGAFVVDGTLTAAVPSTKEITIRLRLRAPGRPEIPLENPRFPGRSPAIGGRDGDGHPPGRGPRRRRSTLATGQGSPGISLGRHLGLPTPCRRSRHRSAGQR